MKKLFAALFAAAMLVSLAGCGNADDGIVGASPGAGSVPTAIPGTHVPQATSSHMPQPSGGGTATAAPSMSAME